MSVVSILLDTGDRVGPVSRRLFGSFVEHLGRCVYTGIFEPGHPTATSEGFRGDVLALVKELGVTTVRYPGGNFVSGYRWEDGVGPDRPKRLDLAWHSTEPNTFGTDEFMAWAKAAGVEPMMALNLGTRSIEAALDLLEYCTIPGGTALSDRRAANGHPAPYGATMWCLGNEMDGPWQIGGLTAHEYGRLASRTAKAMRMIDPALELVACGSSGSGMPTFGAWEREVLTLAYDDVDFVSAHAYYCEQNGDLASFLGSAVDMDHVIETVTAIVDEVRDAGGKTKTIGLSFDEWNVWYQTGPAVPAGAEWPLAPRIFENRYSVADAVVIGDLLITLLRHADRVKAACQAQLVNVIAPIMTVPGGPAWRQTAFHPFALMARHASGEVLRLAVDAPQIDTAKYGPVASVDAVATWDETAGEVALFLANRTIGGDVGVSVSLTGLPGAAVAEACVLHHADHTWVATLEDETGAGPFPLDVTLDGDRLAFTLPPVSWAMVRLTAA